jgi:Bacterial toxin YdaS
MLACTIEAHYLRDSKHKMPKIVPKNKPRNMKRGIKLAIEAVGGHRKLGRLLNVTHQAIGQWTCVPGERLIEVEVLTGVPREQLRPDLFRGFKRVAK